MTEQLSTQDIYKHIMSAPPAEPLTLSPVDLMLLREWLRNDALEIEHLHAELAGSRNDYTALCDENDDLGRINDALVAENGGLRGELDALEAKQ